MLGGVDWYLVALDYLVFGLSLVVPILIQSVAMTRYTELVMEEANAEMMLRLSAPVEIVGAVIGPFPAK